MLLVQPEELFEIERGIVTIVAPARKPMFMSTCMP